VIAVAGRFPLHHEFGPGSRHQSRILLPSGIVNDRTGVNPTERAAASTLLRVIVAPPGGGSPVTSAFSGFGESS
jgi:hypothetical protein